MSLSTRTELEKRVQKALFQHAFLRWESAAVIALTLLLTAFGGSLPGEIPGWIWLLGGMISEAALVYVSLRDPKTAQKVVSDMFRDDFQPQRLKNKELQTQIQKGLDYRTRIAAAIQSQSDNMIKNNLQETAQAIDEWLQNLYNLALRLDRYEEQSKILNQDRQNALKRIAELQGRRNQETDEALQQQIEITLNGLQNQVETINTLENSMKRARLQIEHTLSALGTIYSQAMLVDAKDIDTGRAKRLQHEIAEEVTQLTDILSAMDEVYATNK